MAQLRLVGRDASELVRELFVIGRTDSDIVRENDRIDAVSDAVHVILRDKIRDPGFRFNGLLLERIQKLPPLFCRRRSFIRVDTAIAVLPDRFFFVRKERIMDRLDHLRHFLLKGKRADDFLRSHRGIHLVLIFIRRSGGRRRLLCPRRRHIPVHIFDQHLLHILIVMALIELYDRHRRSFITVRVDPFLQMSDAFSRRIAIFKILRIVFIFLVSGSDIDFLTDLFISVKISVVAKEVGVIAHVAGIRRPECRASDDIGAERLVTVTVAFKECIMGEYTAEGMSEKGGSSVVDLIFFSEIRHEVIRKKIEELFLSFAEDRGALFVIRITDGIVLSDRDQDLRLRASFFHLGKKRSDVVKAPDGICQKKCRKGFICVFDALGERDMHHEFPVKFFVIEMVFTDLIAERADQVFFKVPGLLVGLFAVPYHRLGPSFIRRADRKFLIGLFVQRRKSPKDIFLCQFGIEMIRYIAVLIIFFLILFHKIRKDLL